MSILIWIVMGLLAGMVARWIMPGKQPGGIIVTILLGIGGALVGGFISHHLLGLGDFTGFNLWSFIVAVAGALLLLLIYGLITGRRSA
jgi:uncharacterized membrane protein YeaQ/YmgE (transglycosylase-associated protein family)